MCDFVLGLGVHGLEQLNGRWGACLAIPVARGDWDCVFLSLVPKAPQKQEQTCKQDRNKNSRQHAITDVQARQQEQTRKLKLPMTDES